MTFPNKPRNIDPDPVYLLPVYLESQLVQAIVDTLSQDSRDWPEFTNNLDFFDANDMIDA